MNRTEDKELLPVIITGAEIEWRYKGSKWLPCNHEHEYRIALKPKTCERWCFGVFDSAGFVEMIVRNTEETARCALNHRREHSPDATFSAIVRVEFVEEQKA